ncbi:MAG: gliding motility-associated C-terminal domain-containing protein [Saprospiraceae bacterium]|nr:gliding motility-associated C-terminal domain-containing protein [Saprospiraceae bacterium]
MKNLNINSIYRRIALQLFFSFIWIGITSITNTLQASHIVGGELTYRYLGHNRYELKLVVRRDCINGSDTVPFDNPAIIGVFYRDHQKAFRVGTDGTFRLTQMNNDTIKQKPDNVCPGTLQEVCVHETRYIDTVTIPFDDRGYFIVYQRCCRNFTLTNIEDADEVGTSFVAEIKPLSADHVNSTPAFGEYPPIYACVHKEFTFDHSATDEDGDSLVYSLCTPFLGKTKQFPADRPDKPPYTHLSWKPGFELNNLFGSPATIDPSTGLFKVTPGIIGQFLVAVCIQEFRNGEFLSEVRRDFELNIVNCGVQPFAKFSQKSNICDGLQVQFQNETTNGLEFTWFFDWDHDKTKQSTVLNPTFTYASEGTYKVVLAVKNVTCVDTFIQIIKVIDPQLKPEFSYTLICDTSATLTLKDSSSSKYQIVETSWCIFGPNDSIRSQEKNPRIIISKEGFYEITLKIRDTFGCYAEIVKEINFKFVDAELIGNEASICKGDSIRLVKDSKPGLKFNWNPTNTLNLSNPSNPWAKPSTTTIYSVTITDGGCEVIKQIEIRVKEKIKLNITGDSISCDGYVRLIARADSAKLFKWGTDLTFTPASSLDSILLDTISADKRYFVTAGSIESQCPDTADFLVRFKGFKIEFSKEYVICAGDSLEIVLKQTNSQDTIKIEWEANPIIIGPINQLVTKVYIPSPGRYVLKFKVINQFDCTFEDSIIISAIDHPVPKLFTENECGSLKVKFTTDAKGNIFWSFGDGVGSSMLNPAEYTYPKPGKYLVRLKSDSVCLREVEQEITVVELKINLTDTVIACFGESVSLNPGGDPKYSYKWSPMEGLDNPNSPNPTATVSTSRWYFVTVTDQDFPDSCALYDSIYVLVPPILEAHASPDTFLCEKAKIKLNGTSNLSDVQYVWCDENNKVLGDKPDIEVEIEKTSRYILKVTDKFNCSTKDTIEVILYHVNAQITGADKICIRDTAMLNVIPNPPGMYMYLWEPANIILGNPMDSFIKVYTDTTRELKLTINNKLGCEWMFFHTLIINDPQVSLTVDAYPKIVVAGQTSQLTATFNPNWTYKWSPADGSLNDVNIHNPIASPTKTTTYTVSITDEAGCTASASVTIVVQNCIDAVFLPNAFSPNNDSKNEQLCVRTRPGTLSKMELLVFNRWGEKVFQSSDPAFCWDGSYKNKILSPDVFGYILKFSCLGEEEQIKKGNISLLK